MAHLVSRHQPSHREELNLPAMAALRPQLEWKTLRQGWRGCVSGPLEAGGQAQPQGPAPLSLLTLWTGWVRGVQGTL